MSFRSARADRRGHWTFGRRRSTASDDEIRAALVAIETAFASGVSLRAIARAVGVSDRAVRKWLDGERTPSAEHCRAVLERYGPVGLGPPAAREYP